MNKTALFFIIAGALVILLTNTAPKNPNSVEGEGKFRIPADEEIKKVLAEIANVYGQDTARNVEKVYRAETNHFKSGQYKKSGSPGMLKHATDFPYGWTVANNLWQNAAFRPIGDTTFNVGGKDFTYLVFPDFKSAAFTLAEFIREYGPLRWNSLDATAQAKYKILLDSIMPRFCNEVLPI